MVNSDNDDAIELRKERDYWKRVALYLADCHAATAEYDGQLSKTSQSQRRRYADICNTAAVAMSCGGFANDVHPRTAEGVKDRCVRAVQALGFIATK